MCPTLSLFVLILLWYEFDDLKIFSEVYIVLSWQLSLY